MKIPFLKRKNKEAFHEEKSSKSSATQNPINSASSIEKNVNVIKMAVIVIGFIVFTNYQTLKDIKENGKTIIEFGSNHSEMWISGVDTDINYAKQMAFTLVTLFSNVTSASAKSQFSEILKYAHPLYYNSIRKRLDERKDILEKYKTVALYSRLLINETINKERLNASESPYKNIDTPVYRVSIKESQKRIIGGELSPTIFATIQFDYTVDNATAFLLDIVELKDGNTDHDAEE